MTQEFQDGNVRLIKVGPLGPFANNAYVIADAASGDAVVVDAPQESEKVFPALEGLTVRRIIVTHRHGDHWGGIDALTSHTRAPVSCHADDVTNRGVDSTLADGDVVEVGLLRVQVIFTPGHTPGSICFLVGERLLSGDTLFPGGPGRTMKAEDLTQEIESIRSKLYTLPEGVIVHPGHGADTTIGDSKGEYAVFAAKERPPNLSGDVTWLGS